MLSEKRKYVKGSREFHTANIKLAELASGSLKRTLHNQPTIRKKSNLSLILHIVALIPPFVHDLNSLPSGTLPGGGSRVVIDVVNPVPIVNSPFPAARFSVKDPLHHTFFFSFKTFKLTHEVTALVFPKSLIWCYDQRNRHAPFCPTSFPI